MKLSEFLKYQPLYQKPDCVIYCWACPCCGCDQAEREEPKVGDKVQCIDCDKFEEVEG